MKEDIRGLLFRGLGLGPVGRVCLDAGTGPGKW